MNFEDKFFINVASCNNLFHENVKIFNFDWVWLNLTVCGFKSLLFVWSNFSLVLILLYIAHQYECVDGDKPNSNLRFKSNGQNNATNVKTLMFWSKPNFLEKIL